MNIEECLKYNENGVKPIVVFTKGIEQYETYFENGMMARLANVIDEHDNNFQLVFKTDEFDLHNEELEAANYYDSETGEYNITARISGDHPEHNDWCESLYFDKREVLPFDIISE